VLVDIAWLIESLIVILLGELFTNGMDKSI